ncbi:hypothetical protein [Nostoc sp. WHI]|nr:hypothetical protein [Nostoc sp. WHI]
MSSGSVRVCKRQFSRNFAQTSVQEYQVKLIVYDPKVEVIVQWQN